jgi:hypothetical protein
VGLYVENKVATGCWLNADGFTFELETPGDAGGASDAGSD